MDATTLLLIKLLTDSIISAVSALGNVNSMNHEEKLKRIKAERERSTRLLEILKEH